MLLQHLLLTSGGLRLHTQQVHWTLYALSTSTTVLALPGQPALLRLSLLYRLLMLWSADHITQYSHVHP